MSSLSDDWIRRLHLHPHPEGGYYAETYRSPEEIAAAHLPGRYAGNRTFATAIYFLVKGGSFSSLHRIQSDELWHFYAGSCLSVFSIDPAGNLAEIRLGPDAEAGETFQGVVKAGDWFGSRVDDPHGYALVGCTVAPGFDFADFELADRQALIRQFPQHAEVIRSLTRGRGEGAARL
jgi:predicted cupin superfamily sugar epimerase